jgi:hypothetical protein
MVVAPIRPAQRAALRALLASINRAPGMVDPNYALFHFARFDQLHVARLMHGLAMRCSFNWLERFPRII